MCRLRPAGPRLSDDDPVGRRCPRKFLILAAGGVRCLWACGAQQDFPTETAVDVEPLESRIDQHHKHRPHLRHKE